MTIPCTCFGLKMKTRNQESGRILGMLVIDLVNSNCYHFRGSFRELSNESHSRGSLTIWDFHSSLVVFVVLQLGQSDFPFR